MTKTEFVRRVMSDMAKRKREKIRAAKDKENDYMGVVMDNHRRIARREGRI